MLVYKRKSLELLIAPPYVFLISALIAWLFSWLIPSLNYHFKGQNEIAAVLLVLGGIVGGKALISFIRESTTFHPGVPENTRKLVRKGMYRFTRNPMYLGQLLGLLAWAAFLGNPLSLIGAVFFVLYIDRYQIRPEERILEEKFGEKYTAYKKSVRRWI